MPRLNLPSALAATIVSVLAAVSVGGCTVVFPVQPSVTVDTAAQSTATDVPAEASAAVAEESSATDPERSGPNSGTVSAPPNRDQLRAESSPPRAGGVTLPAGAHPAAGGPIPAQARPAHVLRDGTAILTSPSGNIGCDLDEDYPGCGVHSMIESQLMGSNEIGDSNWWVGLSTEYISSEAPVVSARGDAPLYMYADVPAEVLEYGEMLHHAGIVCASEDNGMTCWNVRTGHGVFMNRREMLTF
ncbi:MAG: hypothetical protein Q4P15_10770 [Propionibacteriaceae bacterium]|nr:hypothetical protein [Propionibacteriaceae bacterium]